MEIENRMGIEYHRIFEYKGVRYDIEKAYFFPINFERVNPYTNYTVNGYIEVSKNSPWYKASYKDIEAIHDIDIHGGLTFSNNLKYVDEDESKWFVGFDTNHAFDDETIRTLEYVKEECEKFIDKWRDMLLGENLSFNVQNYVFRTMKNEEV